MIGDRQSYQSGDGVGGDRQSYQWVDGVGGTGRVISLAELSVG